MRNSGSTEHYIVVRDRRTKHQFSIHNAIIDEWLPIIGLPGYALYSFYCRMANQTDERCFPGYSLIRAHLGLGFATISDYNRLLVWCGLIHIERGNCSESNDYYILDIPEVTSEKLRAIRRLATSELSEDSTFVQALLKRLDNWQPLQAHWERARKTRPSVVHPAQMSLPLEEGTSVGEEGTSVGEDPTSPSEVEQSKPTIQKQQSEENNQQQQAAAVVVRSLLEELGLQEPTLSQVLAVNPDPADVQGWIWYVQTQTGLNNPVGVVANRLRSRQQPPAEFLALARVIAQLDEEDLAILESCARERHWTGRWNLDNERLKELFDHDTLETYYKVYQAHNADLQH
jgi:ADP-ribose pyrophosphatase YjhB (NUDIX family)